jgi:hypothetical protein
MEGLDEYIQPIKMQLLVAWSDDNQFIHKIKTTINYDYDDDKGTIPSVVTRDSSLRELG